MPTPFSIPTPPSSSLFKGILYCIALLFLPVIAIAQQGSGKAGFTLSKDSIIAGNGELAEFTVQLTNAGSETFTGHVVITPGNGVEMVSKTKTGIELQTGESYYVSVKFMMPKRMTADQRTAVRVALQDRSGKTEQADSCRLGVVASKSVNLFLENREVLLKKTLDSIQIPVRLINTGNTSQKVVVVASYPGIVKKATNAQKVLVLPAFSDTVVVFYRRVSSEMFKTNAFYINITGIYFNGEAFGSQVVNAQTARSSRSFSEMGASQVADYNSNSLTVLGQNLFTNSEWYQVLSNGSIDIRHQKLYYNIDASMYKQANGQGLQLRNTFISYRKDDWGFVAGNIGRSYDLNLSGRGIVAFMDDSSHTHYAEAGYIDKSQNLLGMGRVNKAFGVKPGTSAWGSYTYNGSNLSVISAAVYDVTPYTQTKAVLLTNELRWVTKKRYTVRGIFNWGRQSSMLKDSSRNGLGAGIGFDGTLGKFYITSTNYLSTAYYPGMTKGTINLNERVSWLRPKYNLWTAINYFSVAPAPIPGVNYNFNSSRMRVESGISFLRGDLNFSLSPSYNTERANGYLNSGSMQSYHLSVLMNFMQPFRQRSLFFSSEGGVYQSPNLPGTHFHQRTMMNMRYKAFSLNGMFQTGNFFLSEIVYGRATSNKSYTISPQYQKDILSRRARIQCSFAFSNSTISGISIQQNMNIEYDYSLKVRMFAGVDYNYYGTTGYRYANIRAGVTMKLPEARIGSNTRSNTLDVFVFRDMNDNQVFDAGDSIATNAYLTINSMIFITDARGTVKYKNIPEGYYRVNIPPVKGWVAEEKSYMVTKNMRLEIPLQKTGVVKGSVSYLFNQYSYETQKNKDGLFVSAVNSQGVRFTAMTNDEGLFVFYLPAGEYDIDLRKENMPAELECSSAYKQVAVSPQDVIQADFTLKVKERKVETKKFTSRSVASANKP